MAASLLGHELSFRLPADAGIDVQVCDLVRTDHSSEWLEDDLAFRKSPGAAVVIVVVVVVVGVVLVVVLVWT